MDANAGIERMADHMEQKPNGHFLHFQIIFHPLLAFRWAKHHQILIQPNFQLQRHVLLPFHQNPSLFQPWLWFQLPRSRMPSHPEPISLWNQKRFSWVCHRQIPAAKVSRHLDSAVSISHLGSCFPRSCFHSFYTFVSNLRVREWRGAGERTTATRRRRWKWRWIL